MFHCHASTVAHNGKTLPQEKGFEQIYDEALECGGGMSRGVFKVVAISHQATRCH